MKSSFFASAGLHVALLLALVLGLPHLKQEPLELQQPIPIDITDIGEVTTTTKIADGNKAKPEEAAPPQKAPAPEQIEPPKPKPAPPTPEKPVEKPKPKEEEAPTVAEKKKPEPKKKPEKKKEESKEDTSQQFNSLLKNLAQTETPPAPDAVDKAPPSKTPSSSGAQGIVSDKLTISEEDFLRRQIEQCWNVPVGGRDVGNMIVELRIEVNPDRTVKEVTVLDQARMNSDGFFRALAESAVRAVKNARCSPLQLPEDKYELWKVISFRFDPKQMTGM